MAAHFRIGELARRTGVSPELLRAWERRYGLIEPGRTEGGFRLYSEEDERRVRAMLAHLDAGLAAAEAAASAKAAGGSPKEPVDNGAELLAPLLAFDDAAAHAVLDRLLAEFGREAVLVEHVLPVLRALGDGWATGQVSVAQEHFASGLLRGRLLGLARGWDRGVGPRALLCCPPHEQHDLGLVAFGLVLRDQGWRIKMVGADTPLETVHNATVALRPAAVVLAAAEERRFLDVATEMMLLGAAAPVAIGGAGATDAVARATGARVLPLDPIEAAAELARG